MIPNEQLKSALGYWHEKSKDLSPENMSWLDRERRLNMLAAIDAGLLVAELWVDTAVIMIQLFHFMQRRGYWVSWIPTIEKAINVCSSPERYEHARLQSQLSQFYRKSNRYEDAEYVYKQVLQYEATKQSIELKITVLRDQAEGLITQHQVKEAEEVILQALHYTKQENDQSLPQIPFIFDTLGSICRWRGDYDDALEWFQKAVMLRKRFADTHAIASSLNDLSLVHDDMGNYKVGLAILTEALHLVEQTDFHNLKFLIIMNQGVSYYRQNRLDEAENAFLAIDLFFLKRSGDIKNQGITLMNIGNVKMKKGEYEDADPYMQEATAICRSLGDDLRLANCLGGLAEISIHKNQKQQAKLYFEEAITFIENYPENVWGQRLRKNFQAQIDNL